MMRKVIRKLNLLAAVISTLLLVAVAYGDRRLPDLITTCADEVRFSLLYSVRTNADAVAVSAGEADSPTGATLRLLGTIPVKNVSLNKTERRYVSPGGELIGILLRTQGVLVVGTESFLSEGKNVSPGTEAGLKTGDAILSVNGEEVGANQEFSALIEQSGGADLAVRYSRNGTVGQTVLKPRKSDATGKCKCGLWIRDSTNGIGTLTYTDLAAGTVASLGHGIYDVDTNEILNASGGEFRSATLLGVTKGSVGAAGELRGMIGELPLGELSFNCDGGVYGRMQHPPERSDLIAVAMEDEIVCGPAQIIATVKDGEKTCYDIEIEKINRANNAGTKNMVIRVTDPALIETTGGIVQGMSGSPIVQNGMLVGAVTHVFLNDPLKGYAIFADKMLALSESVNPAEAA